MVSEHDLERLEMLLDGELGEAESIELRRRLAEDAGLAHALTTLRSERDLRQQAWRSIEPQEAETAPIVAHVQSAIRRDEVWGKNLRTLRYVSGLAACIVVGFMFGRFIPFESESMSRDRGTGIIFDAGRGPVMEVGTNGASRPTGFKVLLTDNVGRVIAEQRFDTYDEAREFTDDLSRLQNRVRPLRVSDTILTRDQF